MRYAIELRPAPDVSRGGPTNLPVPPPELWEGYGRTDAEYLVGGKAHTARMLEVLTAAGVTPGALRRVMDFGCAAGRMLRFYPYPDGNSEMWGVDISAPHISWCQRYLSPPFLFATTTTFPHLPFEDGYFDLIYCASIFTHITDLADAWLLELRRVTRAGGYLYVTIHDRHTVELLLSPGREYGAFHLADQVRRLDRESDVLRQDYVGFAFDGEPHYRFPQVFYDVEYLTRKWARWLRVVSVTPEAYGHQTALVLRKS